MVLISQKSEYGLRALVDIAVNGDGEPVRRSQVASRQEIPLPYLTQVLGELVSAGLLESSRGPTGGYRLSRPVAEITLLEVVTALQGPVNPTQCSAAEADEPCGRSDSCGLAGVWARLKSASEDVLAETTLEDIIAGVGAGEEQKQEEIVPDDKLDCIGWSCPMPIVRISEKMMQLAPGQVLEVWADDEGAKADIPAWCTGTGNEFLGRQEFGRQMKFLVRKAQ